MAPRYLNIALILTGLAVMLYVLLPIYQDYRMGCYNIETRESFIGPDRDLATWHEKLKGKSLGDKSDDYTFTEEELPEREKHRIIIYGEAVTRDYKQDRLNVHLKPNGKVCRVAYG